MDLNMLKVEVQYIRECPSVRTMLNNAREAVAKLSFSVEYAEVIIKNKIEAEKCSFRGSPSLLVNGRDLYGVLPSPNKDLSCRYYKDGIPTTFEIKKFIELNY